MATTATMLLTTFGILLQLATANEDMLPGNSSGLAEDKPKGEVGPSLGLILGWLLLGCCILYVMGIGYKIMKIMKGTYVEEEPVFLKYK